MWMSGKLTSVVKRKRFKRGGITKHRKPSRASLRLIQQLKRDAAETAEVKRQTKISSRTVELINQKNEGWREEKSKLLYMIALGLTPIPSKSGVIQPSIHIETIPMHTLEDIQRKYQQAEAERLVKFREARRLTRLRRFERIRNWRLEHARASAEAPVECIDLASDDECYNTNSPERFKKSVTFTPERIFILPDSYPNLTIEVSSSSKSNSHIHNPHIRNGKKTFSRDFAKPIVIKIRD